MDCDYNNSPAYMYLKVAQNRFWHSILKTMLLSEAWLDEFQLCIIRKHVNHTSWNKFDNSNTSHNFCPLFQGSVFFLGHIVKAFQNNFAFIISTETCFWLKRVSDRTLAVFSSLETRFNTHNQIAIRNAFRNAFLELLRLSSISQYREYESRGRLCHCWAALRNFIRNTGVSKQLCVYHLYTEACFWLKRISDRPLFRVSEMRF